MTKKLMAAGALALVAASLSAGSAWAWGCTAVASDGAYGYSYNWPDEQDAELKALQECDKNATTNDCQTQDCDPNG